MLRKLARRADMEPVAFLENAIAEHETLDDAADALGVSRTTLYQWMRRYGIKVVRAG